MGSSRRDPDSAGHPTAPAVGGGAIEPLVSPAACAGDAGFLPRPINVDAFVVGVDGSLLRTTFDPLAGAFTQLALAAAAPPSGIGAIEGALALGNADLQVVVTAREGSVWASRWAALTGFLPFERVVPLDPL